MILNNQAIVNRFVTAYKNKFAVEQLAAKAKRTLDISICFEDMAFVATSVKEISPAEKALILINSNLAVAGTDQDSDSLIGDNISAETLKASAENVLGQAANQLSEIWEKVDSLAHCVKAINNSLLSETDALLVTLDIAKKLNESKPSEEPRTLVLQNLPDALKLVKYSEAEYFSSLAEVTERCKNKATNSTAKVIGSLTGLIESGMAEFSSSTLREAEATAQSQNNKVREVLSISTENQVQVSDDGLIIGLDSELTEEDAEKLLEAQTPVDGVAAEEHNDLPKLAPQTIIDEHTLDCLTTCLKSNVELITLCNQSLDLMTREGVAAKVDGFGQAVQKMLISLPSNSRVRLVIKSYCDMFVDVSNLANQEIFFMLCISRYLTSYNELVRDIVVEVSPELL